MATAPNPPIKYRFWLLIALSIGYIGCFHTLNIYKYQTKVPAISGWGSMNGKPIFITGFYSLLCTCLIIAIIYVYTQDKIFSKYVGIFYGFLYVIGGVLFVIEKFVSKTLLPDKLNIYVETLVAYPFLLLCFVAAYQLYNTQRLA